MSLGPRGRFLHDELSDFLSGDMFGGGFVEKYDGVVEEDKEVAVEFVGAF